MTSTVYLLQYLIAWGSTGKGLTLIERGSNSLIQMYVHTCILTYLFALPSGRMSILFQRMVDAKLFNA